MNTAFKKEQKSKKRKNIIIIMALKMTKMMNLQLLWQNSINTKRKMKMHIKGGYSTCK